MAMFNCYVSSPEGNNIGFYQDDIYDLDDISDIDDMENHHFQWVNQL